MTAWTSWLSDVSRSDVLSAGGKGANLGELVQAGFAVPQGFVLGAEAFTRAMDAAGIREEVATIEGTVDRADEASIAEAARRMHELVAAVPFPPDVASDLLEAFPDEVAVELGELGLDVFPAVLLLVALWPIGESLRLADQMLHELGRLLEHRDARSRPALG